MSATGGGQPAGAQAGSATDVGTDPDRTEPDVTDLLSRLVTEDRIRLLSGSDFWHSNAIEHAGIPRFRLSDGPSGVRGERSVGTTSVSFPCGIAIGATFDPTAARRLGDALADECLDRAVHVLLGPTVNLHRHPLSGRHFESYSEDPWLSAVLAVAYVGALQAKGVSATVKHFVANDSEFERHTISSDVDERVLRELYHLPFEAAVHDAGAWAVMSAYNKVNSVYAAENEALLTETLRDEWGFAGAVISDWFGTQSTAASARAGLDLEMPGPPVHYGQRLLDALEAGEVDEQLIGEHARRVLVLAARIGAVPTVAEDQTGAGQSVVGINRRAKATSTIAERQALAKSLAVSSFTLLKNDGVLPLQLEEGQQLAVIGPNAAATACQGGGSARVNPVRATTVLQSLKERFEPRGVKVRHERGCVTWVGTPSLQAELRLEYFAGSGLEDTDDMDGTAIALYEHDSALGAFTWLGHPAPPETGLPSGGWVLTCRARFVPEETGSFMFSLVQVGEARLKIDGELVVSSRGDVGRGRGFFGFGSAEATGHADLEAGKAYELTVDYAPPAGSMIAGLMIGAVPPVGSDDELLRRAEALAATSDAVVCVVGTSAEWETEGHDRASMGLPGLQDELVRRLITANPRTCVLVNAGSPVTMGWAPAAAALGQIWFGGEQIGDAVADVLEGVAEPGGRLPTTIPMRIEDAPAWRHYPGEGGHVEYGEGLLMGYRHYDAGGTEPRFCFGHGLSYTSFELTDLELGQSAPLASASGERLQPGIGGPPVARAAVTVTNTGGRPGSEVVQCYVHDPGRRDGEPVQQLRGFEKVALGPGESARVVIELPERAFASYDNRERGFVVSPGSYEIRVGRSSRDLPLRGSVELS